MSTCYDVSPIFWYIRIFNLCRCRPSGYCLGYYRVTWEFPRSLCYYSDSAWSLFSQIQLRTSVQPIGSSEALSQLARANPGGLLPQVRFVGGKSQLARPSRRCHSQRYQPSCGSTKLRPSGSGKMARSYLRGHSHRRLHQPPRREGAFDRVWWHRCAW